MKPYQLVVMLALFVAACDVVTGTDGPGRRVHVGPLSLTVDGYGTFHGGAAYMVSEPDSDHAMDAELRLSTNGDLGGPRYRDGVSLWLGDDTLGELQAYHRLDVDEMGDSEPRSGLGFIFGDLHYLARDGHIILDTGPNHLRGRFKVRAEEFTRDPMIATGRHQILQGHFETDRLSLVCMAITGPSAPGESSPGVADDGTLARRHDIHHTSPFCQTVRATLEAHAPLR